MESPQSEKVNERTLIRSCIHAREGVAHLDLKPENLFLDENDGLKIADFGLFKDDIYKNLLRLSHASPGYIAPELYLGVASDPYAYDMWAVGCIFAQMLLNQSQSVFYSDKCELELIRTLMGSSFPHQVSATKDRVEEYEDFCKNASELPNIGLKYPF